jgi:hypothetical protein
MKTSGRLARRDEMIEIWGLTGFLLVVTALVFAALFIEA